VPFLALPTLLLVGCGPCSPMGQFGLYRAPFKSLSLPDGRHLVVYRVKSWTFTDGSPPALQIEYEAPFPLGDSAQARALARDVWPLFSPYVEGDGMRVAIMTATNLKARSYAGLYCSSHFDSFGSVAVKDSSGVWHFEGDRKSLPPPDPNATSSIIDVDGRPMPIRGVTRP